MRICVGCKVAKELNEFCKSAAHKTGKCRYCKACKKIKRKSSYNNIKIKYQGLYAVWNSMKRRCSNKNCREFKYYGGRGINVCKKWQKFIPFYNWAITHGFKKGLTIDRENNNGNYTPRNCRFITHTENVRNSRQTKLTVGEVKEIKKYISLGIEGTTIAKKYHVGGSHIGHIKFGRLWKDI